MMFYSLTSRDDSGCARLMGSQAQNWSDSECPACHAGDKIPQGLITIGIDPKRGGFWPDITQSDGRVRGLLFSQRVRDAYEANAIKCGNFLPVQVRPPFPKKLNEKISPNYFLVLGEQGAKFDFAKAGMVIDSVCSNCGRVLRKAQTPIREEFIENSWNGMDIFVTDLSPYSFYCTGRVVDLAKKNRWTCFRFVPLNHAHDYGHPGIDYL